MKPLKIILLFMLAAITAISWKKTEGSWLIEKRNGYTIHYCNGDKENISEYNSMVEKGITDVVSFFHSSFSKPFDITIHPDRQSLDSAWQKDWNMPGYKSECWMVASGTAMKLDMISPKLWDTQSCEHNYAETVKTQKLITHELVHVYHGQLNVSPDFSNTQDIDWFVEGLAGYASGQFDSSEFSSVTKAISAGSIPEHLNDFWTGNLRYALSASTVMFIDNKYGREMIRRLLPCNKKEDILRLINISEYQFLNEWRQFILSVQAKSPSSATLCHIQPVIPTERRNLSLKATHSDHQ